MSDKQNEQSTERQELYEQLVRMVQAGMDDIKAGRVTILKTEEEIRAHGEKLRARAALIAQQ